MVTILWISHQRFIANTVFHYIPFNSMLHLHPASPASESSTKSEYPWQQSTSTSVSMNEVKRTSVINAEHVLSVSPLCTFDLMTAVYFAIEWDGIATTPSPWKVQCRWWFRNGEKCIFPPVSFSHARPSQQVRWRNEWIACSFRSIGA